MDHTIQVGAVVQTKTKNIGKPNIQAAQSEPSLSLDIKKLQIKSVRLLSQ